MRAAALARDQAMHFDNRTPVFSEWTGLRYGQHPRSHIGYFAALQGPLDVPSTLLSTCGPFTGQALIMTTLLQHVF